MGPVSVSTMTRLRRSGVVAVARPVRKLQLVRRVAVGVDVGVQHAAFALELQGDGRHRALHGMAREPEDLAAVAHEQRVRRDQRCLEAQLDRHAAAGLRTDVDGAGEGAQARRDDVESDAAARDLGDRVARREAGQQRESGDLGVARRRVDLEQAAFQRLLADVVQIEAASVVGDLHRDDLATARDGQRDAPFARLAERFALAGRFETVVDGIAQDVQQRIDELVQHVDVDEDVGAGDDERGLFVGRRGRLAHVALQARHDRLDRGHARLRRKMLQLAHEALLLVHDARETRELVLQSGAEVARVRRFLDERTRDRLHFVVLVHFQRVEVRIRRRHRVQLVARGDAADVHRSSPARTGASGWRGRARSARASGWTRP